MEYIIRKAKIDELSILNHLMERSLSVWEYPAKEHKELVEYLQITPEMLQNSVTYVAEKEGVVVGFWCREIKKELSLGRFYIDPAYIGKGVGSYLWSAMIAELTSRGLEYFTLLSDPNAQGFYEKKGAHKIGDHPSEIFKGENLPIMKYYLK